jgi:hypothetical protein
MSEENEPQPTGNWINAMDWVMLPTDIKLGNARRVALGWVTSVPAYRSYRSRRELARAYNIDESTLRKLENELRARFKQQRSPALPSEQGDDAEDQDDDAADAYADAQGRIFRAVGEGQLHPPPIRTDQNGNG